MTPLTVEIFSKCLSCFGASASTAVKGATIVRLHKDAVRMAGDRRGGKTLTVTVSNRSVTLTGQLSSLYLKKTLGLLPTVPYPIHRQ